MCKPLARSARTVVSILTLLAAAWLSPISWAQNDSAKAKPAETDVVNANEVMLDLAVRDNKDKPIVDLKPEDIAVSDGGVPVRLSSLRRVGTDSNDHLLTLVFDRLDLAAGYNARDITGKILKALPQNLFSYCVLKVQGRLMLYQDASTDRNAVSHAVALATSSEAEDTANAAAAPEKTLIAIARTGSDDTGTSVDSKQRAVDQVLLSSLQESQRILQEQHAQPSLSGLLALARMERKLPGRKAIIYFSQGLQTDASAGEMLHYIIESANRSDVSIYAIDANALTSQVDQSMLAMMAIGNARAAMAQAPAAATTSGSGAQTQTVAQPPPGLAPMVSQQYERYESADPNANKNPLADLAEKTGGAYLAPGESLKKPMRRMTEDMTAVYEAYYVPPIENYDGRFRPIAVKPVRKKMKVHTRPGYFALPPDSGMVIRPFEMPLLKLLAEPQLPSDVNFRSRIIRLGDLPSGDENALVLEVPLSQLQTQDDANTNLYTLHVAMVAEIKNKAGAVIAHFSEDVPRHGALDAKAAGGQSEVVTMERHFVTDPGEYVMEAVILDRNSGKAGAQRVEFEVPNASTGPELSDLTLVRNMLPFPSEADSDEPLQYGSSKVVPSLSGSVTHESKDVSFFFFVHPDANASESPTLEMEVRKNGESIAQVPLPLRKTSGPAAIPYMASIQSASLSAGNYQAIERLTQNGKSVEQQLSFRVQGPELAQATGAPGVATIAGATAADADLTTTPEGNPSDAEAHTAHSLVITPLPPGTVSEPSLEQLQSVIASARKRAIEYSATLPNFVCVEVTNRSVDPGGNNRWRHRDSIAELLRYQDSQETRTTLEVNGQRSSLSRAEMNTSWPLSVGEFGSMLNLVFQPSSKAEFEWKETGTREDRTGNVQVLRYRVAKQNATITLGEGNDQIGVGFHGLVYIDSTTGAVERITLDADDLPPHFGMSAAAMTVDYDYVAIGGRDYVLPVRSSVRLQRHHREIELNEISFRSYRRFGSRTKIKVLQ